MSRPETFEGSCPHCQQAFQAVLLPSFYIDSVRLWSDGYQESSDWNNAGADDWRPCPSCKRLMELSNARLTMRYEPKPPPRKPFISKLGNLFRKKRPVADPLTLRNLSVAKMIHPSSIQEELDSFILPPATERRLRRIEWLRWNHSQESNKPTHAWHAANMEHLLSLPTERTEESVLIRAELLRHLGRFEEALASIRSDRHVVSEKNRYVAELMTQACRDRLTEPFVIKERFSEQE